MKNTNLLLLTVAACATLAACGGGEKKAEDPSAYPMNSTAGNVLVYESRQAIQCESAGLTPAQSAQKLVNGGIDVLESNCGANALMYVAVCGAGNGDILIHRIRRSNLDDAERLGFNPVEELANPTDGLGYTKFDCETREPLPPG